MVEIIFLIYGYDSNFVSIFRLAYCVLCHEFLHVFKVHNASFKIVYRTLNLVEYT